MGCTMPRPQQTARRNRRLDARRAQFKRALDWAEAQELIASHEIDDVVYLRLCSHEAGEPNE